MDPSFLANEGLFHRPASAQPPKSVDDFIAVVEAHPYIPRDKYGLLIDYTYFFLQLCSLEEAFRWWEIRLTLLLFNNQLTIAKKEALNVNNALYVYENGPQEGPVLPLPKNNNGLIPYELLVLLLRLKSAPTLLLVNDLYKLCYQLRLNPKHSKHLATRLANISYEIVCVLTITKHQASLRLFLAGILDDLDRRQLPEAQYRSNISLIYTILLLLNDPKADVSSIFDNVNESSLESLQYVLTTVSPTIVLPPAPDQVSLASLEDLRSLISQGAITGRIICSLLGLWDLTNTYNGTLTNNTFEVTLAENDRAYQLVVHSWSRFIYKVYCLE